MVVIFISHNHPYPLTIMQRACIADGDSTILVSHRKGTPSKKLLNTLKLAYFENRAAESFFCDEDLCDGESLRLQAITGH